MFKHNMLGKAIALEPAYITLQIKCFLQVTVNREDRYFLCCFVEDYSAVQIRNIRIILSVVLWRIYNRHE
ncbi:hypothetical protein D3C81_1639470 [compost metagenome]